MKTYRLYQVDSFTKNRFHGNPAGVVPQADGLTDEQMQRITRELNNSETAFILQTDTLGADVEVRFFTPTAEVPICSNDLLHNLTPDLQKLSEISQHINCNGFYVFTLNPEENILVHGRMFAPAIGIAEDPVTGNANGPLGAYLVHFDILQNDVENCFDFDIMQGEAIGRDGTMHVHVEKEYGKPRLVQITGNAVIAFKTEIEY